MCWGGRGEGEAVTIDRRGKNNVSRAPLGWIDVGTPMITPCAHEPMGLWVQCHTRQPRRERCGRQGERRYCMPTASKQPRHHSTLWVKGSWCGRHRRVRGWDGPHTHDRCNAIVQCGRSWSEHRGRRIKRQAARLAHGQVWPDHLDNRQHCLNEREARARARMPSTN